MAVNLCAAHKKTDLHADKKTDLHAAHKVLLTCFLQLSNTRRWISCSARNIAYVLYTKVNSCVTHEFGLSHLTKIEERTSVATREFQLRRELYHSSVKNNTILRTC